MISPARGLRRQCRGTGMVGYRGRASAGRRAMLVPCLPVQVAEG